MNRSDTNRCVGGLIVSAMLFTASCSGSYGSDPAIANSNSADPVPPTIAPTLQNSNNNASVPEANIASAGAPTSEPMAIVKKAGWIRFDESKLEAIQARKKVEGDVIFVTSYSPRLPMKVSLKCDGSVPAEKCSQHWLGWDYYAEQLYVYDSNRRVFKIIAMMHRTDQLDSLASYGMAFLDNDGDGKFETLSSSFDNWPVPRWARK